MTNGIKNPRVVGNAWSLPSPVGGVKDENQVLVRGQELKVDVDAPGFDFIPCFPKPGTEKTITRIANGSWIVFLGTVEFNGVSCLEFMTKIDDEDVFFYLGEGAFPHLLNIPRRLIRPGNPFYKKSGSKVALKGGSRRKSHGNRKRLGTGKINLATGMVQGKTSKQPQPKRKAK